YIYVFLNTGTALFNRNYDYRIFIGISIYNVAICFSTSVVLILTSSISCLIICMT
ncbi:hypothetical protein L9F63_026723, partial [Diploptera punctata]